MQKNFVDERERNNPVENIGRRWDDIIKIDLKETNWEIVAWNPSCSQQDPFRRSCEPRNLLFRKRRKVS
jgi:hypothetical protein